MLNKTENNFSSRLESVLAGRQRAALDAVDLKPAGVLVPIIFRQGDPHLILTRRTETVAQHKGQISFPGGATEPVDDSVVETALRETHEEIGVSPESIRVLGKLDDFATISGYLVTPVVGIVADTVEYRTDENEVAELFEASLFAFQNPKVHELITVEHDGTPHEYHSYQIGHRVVWGATAGIIHRLLSLIEPRRVH